MRVRMMMLLLAAVLSGSVPMAYSQTAPAPAKGRAVTSAARLNQLPPALRGQGRAILDQRDDEQRARLAADLGKKEAAAAMDFLLSVLEADPSPKVRSAVVHHVGRYSHPRVRQALKAHAMTDADVSVAMLALDRLRSLQNQDLVELLKQRLEKARSNGNEAELRLLAQEQERWISLIKGTMLPAFMRATPPAFSLKADKEPVRVLAFGDFGTGSATQAGNAFAVCQRRPRFCRPGSGCQAIQGEVY